MRVVPELRTRSFVDFLECARRLASAFLHCKGSFRWYNFWGDLVKIFVRLNKLYVSESNSCKEWMLKEREETKCLGSALTG